MQLFGWIIIHNEVGKGRKMNERCAEVDHIYARNVLLFLKHWKSDS